MLSFVTTMDLHDDELETLDYSEFEEDDEPESRPSSCGYLLFLLVTILIVIAILLTTFPQVSYPPELPDGRPIPTPTLLPRA